MGRRGSSNGQRCQGAIMGPHFLGDSTRGVRRWKGSGLSPRNPAPVFVLGPWLGPSQRAVDHLEARHQSGVQMWIVPAMDMLEGCHGRRIRIGLRVLGKTQLLLRTVRQRGVQYVDEVPYCGCGQSVVQNRGYWINGNARRSLPSYEPSTFCFCVGPFGNHEWVFPLFSRVAAASGCSRPAEVAHADYYRASLGKMTIWTFVSIAKCCFEVARALMNSVRFRSLASNSVSLRRPRNSSYRSQIR
jgi:hypothetical protein